MIKDNPTQPEHGVTAMAEPKPAETCLPKWRAIISGPTRDRWPFPAHITWDGSGPDGGSCGPLDFGTLTNSQGRSNFLSCCRAQRPWVGRAMPAYVSSTETRPMPNLENLKKQA